MTRHYMTRCHFYLPYCIHRIPNAYAHVTLAWYATPCSPLGVETTTTPTITGRVGGVFLRACLSSLTRNPRLGLAAMQRIEIVAAISDS